MKLSELLPLIDKDNRVWIYAKSADTGLLTLGGAYFDQLPERLQQQLKNSEVINIHSMINYGIIGLEVLN